MGYLKDERRDHFIYLFYQKLKWLWTRVSLYATCSTWNSALLDYFFVIDVAHRLYKSMMWFSTYLKPSSKRQTYLYQNHIQVSLSETDTLS